MILAYLRDDPRHWQRKYISRLFTALVNLISGNHIRYYNGTSIHLRYNVMRWHSDTYGFAFNAEIVTRLSQRGGHVRGSAIDNVEAAGRVSRPSASRTSSRSRTSLLRSSCPTAHAALQGLRSERACASWSPGSPFLLAFLVHVVPLAGLPAARQIRALLRVFFGVFAAGAGALALGVAGAAPLTAPELLQGRGLFMALTLAYIVNGDHPRDRTAPR